MSLPELIVTLLLGAGAVWGWWLIRLENILKGYRGEGRLSLIRGRFPWQVDYCVQLGLPSAVSESAQAISLAGLPAGRIYSIALSVPGASEEPAWHLKPFRLRLDNHGKAKIAVDAASLPLVGCYRNGHNRYHFPAQASFRVSESDKWSLAVTFPSDLTSETVLLVTSQHLS